MKPSQLLKILGVVCAVLVVLWLVYLYKQVPHHQMPYAKAMAKTDAITLQRGGQSVQLVRTSTSTWTVQDVSGVSYPTQSDRVKTLIDGLTALQLDDVISDRADRATDFDVTPESGIRITALLGKKVLADGIIGKQATDFSHLYFRFSDSPQVYLATGLIRGQVGSPVVGEWRSKDLIELPDSKIERIQLQSPAITADFVRSTDTWTMNGAKIDPNPVYGLVGALAHLKADDFVTPLSSTWTVEAMNWGHVAVTANGQTIVLHIGQEDPVFKRYPAVITAPSFVWLYENKIQQIFPNRATFKKMK